MWFRPIVIAAVLLVPAAQVGHAAASEPVSGRAPVAVDTTPSTTVPEPAPVVTDNPFIPENANLGDCVSSLPRPECGSEARGGVGQWMVLGALVAGLGFIGWRVSRGMRRGRPTPEG